MASLERGSALRACFGRARTLALALALAGGGCQALFAVQEYADVADAGPGDGAATTTSASTGGGGATGVGGAGGAGAGAGGGAGGAGGGCVPLGIGGAMSGSCPGINMVAVTFQDSQEYCIDRTEVTREDYLHFLQSCPSLADQPPECGFNTSFEPKLGSNDCDPAKHGLDKDPTKPVVCVDWCDAWAYCHAAGKRLCGHKNGGGAYDFGQANDANVSEWFNACTDHGLNGWMYGNSFDPTKCVGDEYDGFPNDGASDDTEPVPVATCKAPVHNLWDMSGNVWEWDNSCTGATGAEDQCHDRGGSFWDMDPATRCDSASPSNHLRGHFNKNIGIRCCGSIVP